MMGMIVREEVEFALGPFTMTAERGSASDLSFPLNSDNKAILTVRPRVENDISAFLKPYTTEVWLVLLASVVCVESMMVWLMSTEEKIFNKRTRNVVSKKVSQTWVWVLQVVTLESPQFLHKRDAGRLIATSWLLASIVFAASYGGVLTAMLTVPRVTIPIDSLPDLVSQTKLPWRLEAGSMITRFLLESGDPMRQRAVTAMSGSIPNCWEARQELAEGKFAAICDETTMKKVMDWEFSANAQCHLYIAREKVLTNAMVAMAFRKNSSYLSKVNKIIHTVKEAGLISKWLGEQVTNASQCLRPPSSDKRDGIAALNLDAFAGPLLILLGGIYVGVIVFVGEHLAQHTRKHNVAAVVKLSESQLTQIEH
nr:glutamate receptor-like [Cherax quadricarinatus]